MNELLKIDAGKITGTHQQDAITFPVTGTEKIFKTVLIIKDGDLIIVKRLSYKTRIQHL